MGWRWATIPLMFLALALAVRVALALSFSSQNFGGDEAYYVQKAEFILRHHALQPLTSAARAAEFNRAWGTSDWRPQGFPLFLAVCGLDRHSIDTTVRFRVTFVHGLLVSTVILFWFLFLRRVAPACEWPAALVFALAPWPTEFVAMLGPETLTGVLTAASLLSFVRWIEGSPSATRSLVWATAAVSACLLLRPEWVVMPPLIVGAATLIKRKANRAVDPRSVWSRGVPLAAAIFILFAVGQYAYGTWLTGTPRLYGTLRIMNAGAFQWTRTWFGTEKEAYDFVYAITEARPTTVPLRAFDTAEERAQVGRIVARIMNRGHYSAEDDTEFSALAMKRSHRRPVRVALVRLSNVLHLWINTEVNRELLLVLSEWKYSARLPVLVALLLFRGLLLVAGFLAGYRSFKRIFAQGGSVLDHVSAVCFSLVVIRTLLVGLVLDWKVYRYMHAAWIPLMICALAVVPSTKAPVPEICDPTG